MRLFPMSILILAVAFSAGCGGVPLTLAAVAPAGTVPLTCAEMEALLAGYDLERREGSADLVARRTRGEHVFKLTMTITGERELRVVATRVEAEERVEESIGPIGIGFGIGGGEKAPDTRTEADARSIVSECAGPPIEVTDTVPEASSP